MSRLGELGTVITGNTPKTSDSENYVSNDICFVKPSDIVEDDISMLSSTEFYISEYARSKSRILPKQSILVTCIGIIGKVAINEIECSFNQQINAIIPNNNMCNTKYLAYAIHSKKRALQVMANAAVVPIINKKQFSDIEITLPPMEQQQHIAAVLGKVSELIDLRKRQLAKLDELVKARFVEMFQDESIVYPKKRIDLVCREIIAGGDRPKDTSDMQTEDYPYPVFANAATNEGVLCYAKTYRIESASVTVSARGSTVGYTAIREGKYTPVVRLIALVPNDELTPIYLKQYLDVNHCVVSTGSAQPQVTIPYIKGIEVVVPPLKEQDTFTKLVKQVDKQKLTIQQSLDKLETLKKSLMQEHFG